MVSTIGTAKPEVRWKEIRSMEGDDARRTGPETLGQSHPTHRATDQNKSGRLTIIG